MISPTNLAAHDVQNDQRCPSFHADVERERSKNVLVVTYSNQFVHGCSFHILSNRDRKSIASVQLASRNTCNAIDVVSARAQWPSRAKMTTGKKRRVIEEKSERIEKAGQEDEERRDRLTLRRRDLRLRRLSRTSIPCPRLEAADGLSRSNEVSIAGAGWIGIATRRTSDLDRRLPCVLHCSSLCHRQHQHRQHVTIGRADRLTSWLTMMRNQVQDRWEVDGIEIGKRVRCSAGRCGADNATADGG